jgi:hypothetical protein
VRSAETGAGITDGMVVLYEIDNLTCPISLHLALPAVCFLVQIAPNYGAINSKRNQKF